MNPLMIWRSEFEQFPDPLKDSIREEVPDFSKVINIDSMSERLIQVFLYCESEILNICTNSVTMEYWRKIFVKLKKHQNISEPMFTHDCEECTFLGVYYDHDVYTCRGSIIARFGDDGPEYASMSIAQMHWLMGGDIEVNGVSQSFSTFLCSNSADYHKPMYAAMMEHNL